MKKRSLNCFSPFGGSWKWKVKVKMERLLFHNGAFCPWVWRIGSDVLATTHLNLLTSKSIKRNHPTTTNHSVSKSKNNFCLLATLCGDARKFFVKSFGSLCENIKKTLMIQHLFFKCAQSIYQTNGQVVCMFFLSF